MMKYLPKIFVFLLLAMLGLSLSLPISAQEDEELKPGLAMYVGSRATNLRSEADNGAEQLGSIEPRAIMTVIQIQEDGWIQVEYEGQNGWLRNPPLINITEDDLLDPDDPLLSPTGPYQVGQAYLHWIDSSREELFTEDETDHRELVISIWYPADVSEGTERALYWEALSGRGKDAWKAILADSLTNEQYDQFAQLKSHAYRDVLLAESDTPYPVIIMSHGYPAWIELTTNQAVELASYGYVVVGIQHTFIAVVTVLSDDRIAEFVSFDVQGVEEQALRTGAEDAIFVLNQLESLDEAESPAGMFAVHLDLDRVGMFGESTGGEISVMAASMDDRILAIINEDGTANSGKLPRPAQPFLFFSSGDGIYPTDGPNFTARVRGFEHLSFSDAPSEDFMHGQILPRRSAEIIRAYVLAFFDEYLKGIDQPLLDGPSDDFPEVDFRINNEG